MESTIHPRYIYTLEQEMWCLVVMNPDTGKWECEKCYRTGEHSLEDQTALESHELAIVVPVHVAEMMLGI